MVLAATRRWLVRASILGLVLLMASFLLTILWSASGSPPAWYSDPQFVLWVGVVVNLAVVVIAIFLNVIVDGIRQPRFNVTCREVEPWLVETKPAEGGDTEMLHLRLRVQNTGRSHEEACEARVERVLRLYATDHRHPEARSDHDPRPLKWVGRDTKPLTLSAGAFDFADLGVHSPETPDLFRVDFADRGHLDLWLDESELGGYRIAGTVYGKRAKPRPFAFDLTWGSPEHGAIRVKEH